LSGAPASGEAAEVAAARRVAADVAPRGDEIERGRRLPPDLARRFAAEGFFGLCVPERYGGRERSVRDLVRVIEEIAIGDGAAGWCVMIGATTGLLAASLPDEWARHIYGRDPGVITGGVTAPTGRARPAEGGHLVRGRWAFGSGVQHSDWMAGGCVMTDGAEPLPGPHGMPETRLMFFEPDQLVVHDTWYSSGLRGTGSHDFEVRDAFVPEGRSVLWGGRPRVEGPLYQFPALGLLAVGVAAVSLGIARRAIDELIGLAGSKVPTGARRALANRPSVQRQVGEAESLLGSARAYVFEAIESAWRVAERGQPVAGAERLHLRLAATHATQQSAAAVDRVYRAGGGTSIFESSPLQRCFRDVHVATQHIMVTEPTLELFGQVLLGVSDGRGRL
jgi:alkylation response protein AidB-like acyl-CoA dehydrogenase